METYRIKSTDLPLFFNSLNQSGPIIAPVLKSSGKVFFQPVNDWSEVAADYIQTAFSAKEVVFPRVEELFSFHRNEGTPELATHLKPIPETLVWGLRPCDAAAFDYLDRFFLADVPDAYYKERREKTTLVAISCAVSDASCFCTSVGLHPGSAKGADLLLTHVDEFYLAEVVTDKGKALIDKNNSLFIESDSLDKESHLAVPETRFSMDIIREKLLTSYENAEWKMVSMGCYGCSACAFSCPTCTCFDIQDEGTQQCGRRIRCWDACGQSQFTRHASGHNPRTNQTERRRQRLLHKFRYSVENLGIVSCVGCGRCIRVCPSHLNIFENLLSVAK